MKDGVGWRTRQTSRPGLYLAREPEMTGGQRVGLRLRAGECLCVCVRETVRRVGLAPDRGARLIKGAGQAPDSGGCGGGAGLGRGRC